MRLHNIFLTITILLCELFAVAKGNLPPEITKCKSTDNSECVRKTIEEILKLYPTGNSEFGMTNISALNITNLQVARSNQSSPVQINFKFAKCTVYGLEKAKVLKISGYERVPRKVVIEAIIPSLKLKGDYEMTGKLLLLPLKGHGIGEIDLRESTVKIRVVADNEMRNNKTYLKITKVKVLFNPKKLVVKLENVFNDNPILSDSINDVINENWQDVWSEMKDGINPAAETILKNVVNDIFEFVPLEDMFSD